MKPLTYPVIEPLNSLLRAELTAVAGYQKTLRALKKKAVGDHDQILRLASEHQRTVKALVGVQWELWRPPAFPSGQKGPSTGRD